MILALDFNWSRSARSVSAIVSESSPFRILSTSVFASIHFDVWVRVDQSIGNAGVSESVSESFKYLGFREWVYFDVWAQSRSASRYRQCFQLSLEIFKYLCSVNQFDLWARVDQPVCVVKQLRINFRINEHFGFYSCTLFLTFDVRVDQPFCIGKYLTSSDSQRSASSWFGIVNRKVVLN